VTCLLWLGGVCTIHHDNLCTALVFCLNSRPAIASLPGLGFWSLRLWLKREETNWDFVFECEGRGRFYRLTAWKFLGISNERGASPWGQMKTMLLFDTTGDLFYATEITIKPELILMNRWRLWKKQWELHKL